MKETVEMRCKDCDEEMKLIDMPQAVFTIPFTNGRFAIWDWNKKGFYCEDCAYESERKIHRAIEDSVDKQAYEEGFNDGRYG